MKVIISQQATRITARPASAGFNMKRIKCDLQHRSTRCRKFLYRKFRGKAIANLCRVAACLHGVGAIAVGFPDQQRIASYGELTHVPRERD